MAVNLKEKRDLLYKQARELFAELISLNCTRKKKVKSVMAGVFIGLSPLWGLQTITSVFASYIFKLNKVLTIGASFISLPPLIPVIIYGGYQFGGVFFPNRAIYPDYSENISYGVIIDGFWQYLVGSIILATLVSLLAGALAYLLLRFWIEGNNENISHQEE